MFFSKGQSIATRILLGFFVVYLCFLPGFSVVANDVIETNVTNNTNVVEESLSYPLVMRELRMFKEGKDGRGEILGTEELEEDKARLISQLAFFIKQEEQKLKELEVLKSKRNDYLDLLRSQLKELKGEVSFLEKVKNFFGFGSEDKEAVSEKLDEARMPDNPASFKFNDEPVEVQRIKIGSKTQGAGVGMQEADDLPTLLDLQATGTEIVINTEIEDLARELENNPVKIYNYVRNNIDYEPYYGAKKGGLGCLAEKICNDVDAASLTISLLRASGIPARYKKSAMVVSAERLQNLLGVESNNASYRALGMNQVPVFVLSDIPDGSDLSGETEFALEWVLVEAFYEYDERGANINNWLDLGAVENEPELAEILSNYPKKQWIPLDVIFKDYLHIQNEIVHQTADFDTESFWYDYLQIDTELSPMDKYIDDLEGETSKNIRDDNYQSKRVGVKKDFDILPPGLPYDLARAEGEGIVIEPETWSFLPEERISKVKISLLREADSSVVLEQTFYGSEVNNQEVNLSYQGLSEADELIIENYGGIPATPASLVEIAPVLESGYSARAGEAGLSIGERLILRFEYIEKGELRHLDEKFSIAGNNEGIYISLSMIIGGDENSASEILLDGNVGLAREYLKTIEEDSRLLAGAYDHSYNIIFTRAVVTQNRILSEVEGVPTTFEFKGLTIDGTIFVSDYSNRDNWEEFRRDFHLLAGLNASFYEAEIFEEIAGLESISTVRGLQYAYARPDEYTVHIIDASNSGEIDGLDLSENTKANMRAEVALGKEIITPDKFVETGNWRGLFYISLAEDGTAQYAIGEQVLSNGGWTTSELLQYIYVDEDEKGRQGFLRQFEEESFYYEDSKSVKSDEVMCRITDAEYNAVTGGSDWSSTFGYPCNIGSVSFGEVDHAYIQASNAAHFYREGWYDYWTTTSRIKQKINSYIAEKKSLDSEDLNYLKSGNTYTFRFSPTLGTYVQSICEDKPILTFWFLKKCTTLGTVYYSPAGTDGNIYRTRGEILSKLDKDNQVIIKKIGFPVSDETLGGESELVRGVNNGRYQSFINGEVFGYDPYFIPLFSDRSPKVLNSVFYTYGLITEVHKLMGRTEGELGYPLNDARQGTDGDIYQTYEGKKEIKYDTTTRLVGVVNLKEYRCELYGHFDGNTSALSLIQISGFLEGLGSEISDDIEFSTRLAGQIGRGLIHLDETMIEFDRILSKTTNQDIWNKVKGAYGAAAVKMQEVKNEYDQATEPDGCDARIIYYHGKLIGVATAYIIPAEELFALAKARAIARPKLVSDFLEEAGGTMGKFGKEMRFVNTVDRNQWRYIKTILDSNEKGRKAEELMQRMLGGEKTPFLSGDRIVDLWVENKKFANEIKTQARNVSYTGLTKDQINADIRLMNSADEFHPMWHFLENPPTGPLMEFMEKNGISYYLYIE